MDGKSQTDSRFRAVGLYMHSNIPLRIRFSYFSGRGMRKYGKFRLNSAHSLKRVKYPGNKLLFTKSIPLFVQDAGWKGKVVFLGLDVGSDTISTLDMIEVGWFPLWVTSCQCYQHAHRLMLVD